MRRPLVAASLLCCVNPLSAIERVVPFDGVHWQAAQSPEGCSLYTGDNFIGVDVAFRLAPGKPLSLTIAGHSFAQLSDKLQIETTAPVWGNREYQLIQLQQLNRGSKQAELVNGAHRLYRDLLDGAWLTIRDEHYKVSFPTVNMHDAIDVFHACMQSLPPVGYQQASSTVLQLPFGGVSLNSDQKALLKDIGALVKLDSRIQKVRVSGHSDNKGDLVRNLKLSKRRAEAVADLLSQAGVPKDMIEIRGHGSRYPLLSSNTAKGRDANRRVEVELIKQ